MTFSFRIKLGGLAGNDIFSRMIPKYFSVFGLRVEGRLFDGPAARLGSYAAAVLLIVVSAMAAEWVIVFM